MTNEEDRCVVCRQLALAECVLCGAHFCGQHAPAHNHGDFPDLNPDSDSEDRNDPGSDTFKL